MITRFCALLLLVLVVSPFTAPFSTFDVAQLPRQATQEGTSLQSKSSSDKSLAGAVGSAPDPPAFFGLSLLLSVPSISLIAPPASLHFVLRL